MLRYPDIRLRLSLPIFVTGIVAFLTFEFSGKTKRWRRRR